VIAAPSARLNTGNANQVLARGRNAVTAQQTGIDAAPRIKAPEAIANPAETGNSRAVK
jgi:hypothetical protein